jgi:hypothetical protein
MGSIATHVSNGFFIIFVCISFEVAFVILEKGMHFIGNLKKKKVKQSRYKAGVA